MGWLAAIVDCHRHIAIAILCIVALVLYIAATSVQDPLARFPGPWLARFTNIYAAWHAFRGDMHLDIQRCHRQYGKFRPRRPAHSTCLLSSSNRRVCTIWTQPAFDQYEQRFRPDLWVQEQSGQVQSIFDFGSLGTWRDYNYTLRGLYSPEKEGDDSFSNAQC